MVKCFASVTVEGARAGMAVGTTETVGIYRDAALHAVAPMPVALETTLAPVPTADAETVNLGILSLDEHNDGVGDARVNGPD